MSDATKIEVQRDAQLIVLHVSIAGVARKAKTVADERHALAREIERRVDTRIANVDQHARALELVNRVRSLIPRYAISTPLGWLTDKVRSNRLANEWGDLKLEIHAHNFAPYQAHGIRVDLHVIPIGVALDAEAQRLLCDTVYESLSKVKALLRAGDWKEALVWSSRNKNLHTLMPALVGAVVSRAIDCVREQRAHGAKQTRDALRDGALTIDDIPEAIASKLDLEPLENALGWVAPPLPAEIESVTH